MKNLKGFTLAEVLITLAIIGIVAAITIPIVVNNNQKTQYVSGLKKGFSVIQSGIKMMMADENVTNLDDLSMFDGTDSWVEPRQTKHQAAIKKHFRVTKYCTLDNVMDCTIKGYKYLNGNDAGSNFGVTAFYTLDGMAITLGFERSCPPDNTILGPMKALCGTVMLDINGPKKPNTYGRDLYVLTIGHDGALYPTGGQAESMYQCGEYWENCNWSCPGCAPAYCGRRNDPDISQAGGSSCAARIMENGWKMDY